jgi:predicted solute-binding protein
VAGALRAVKEAGGRRLREIARLQRDFDAEFAQRYLTEFIKFDLGAEEKAGLERFRELLEGEGLLDAGRGGLRFV